MTYFHINLDPRGKKKKVLPPLLIPMGTVWLFSLFVCLFSFYFIFRLSSGRSEGLRPPRGPPLGVWFRLCRPAKPSVIRGWASIFLCLYSDFRCSVLTPVLHQCTPTECVNQGIHPRLPVCPQYVCCRVGHV